MTNKPMLSVDREVLEGLLRECAIEFSTSEASQFELEMLAKIRSALGAKASDQEGSMADGWQFMPMAGRHKEQWLGCKNRSEMDELKRRGLLVRNLYANKPATAAMVMPDVDDLSNIIRRVDGSHTLGAGALAEAILAEVAKINVAKP